MWKRVKKGIGCRCEDDNEGEDERNNDIRYSPITATSIVMIKGRS
jgi:hypothetical protein